MVVAVELLEREGALAALAEARDAAARGAGRVVFVTGEPGIGKTSLVTRSLRGLGPGARVLLGTCDDLSIPRPLGPIRDLAGSVSRALERGARRRAPRRTTCRALLLAELELPPRPTVLVLEDVHWADDATLDAITVLGRRIGSLPGAARAHLPQRRGAARAPAARGGRRDPRRATRVVLELAPLSAARGRVARRRRRGRGLRRDRRQPVLRHRAARLARRPPSCRRRSRTRCSAARRGSTTPSRRLVELVSVVPSRVRTSRARRGDAGLAGGGGGAGAPAAARGRRRPTCASATSSRGTRSGRASRSRRGGGCTARSSTALLAPMPIPPRSSTTPRPRAPRTSSPSYALVAARRAAALESNREAYSHYRRAADFVDRLPPAEQAARARGAGGGGVRRRPARGRVRGDRARDRALRRARRRGGGRSLHARRSRASTGSPATATRRGRRRSRRSRSSSRSASRSSSPAPTAASRSSRCSPRTPTRRSRWGERALELATRLGDERTRAHAIVNIGSAQLQLDPDDSATLLEAHASPTRPATGTRRRARSSTSAYTLMCWARPEPGAALRRAGARVRAASTRCTPSPRTPRRSLAWLRLRAGRVGRGRAPDRAREIEQRRRSRSCSRRPCSPSSRSAAATRTPRERLADLVGAGRPHRRAAADRPRRSSWRSSGR